MKEKYIGRYVIVRGDRSGVFAGTLKARDGRTVTLENARRLWYWDGACSDFQIANDGVTNPENCKFTVTVAEIEILDVIEVIPCTERAEACIKAVKVWKR